MNRKVILFGNGGHARVITDIVRRSQDVVVGFLCDPQFSTENALGLNYLGAFVDCLKYAGNDTEFVLAVGDNAVRRKLSEQYDLPWYTAVHPSAVIDPSVQIGAGTVVMAGAVINSCAVIGSQCILNTGSVVEHDCRIGSWTHLSPLAGICGCCVIGDEVHLGAGATVIDHLSICSNVTVGAGSTVIWNITEPGIYVGVPVRKIQRKAAEK